MRCRIRLAALAALTALCAGLSAAKVNAQAPSIWTDVMGKKKLTSCIVPSYQPYSWKDDQQKWQGFVAEMARDVAADMHVDLDFVESSFKTVVLDLQSGKCDAFFGFNATPERALAIDFAGPLYTLGFIFINRNGWQPPGPAWSDYNNPNIRVCYPLGTSMEQQAKRWDPKATLIGLGSTDECLLAVQTGRADAYLAATLDGLVATHKNPQVGTLTFPQPSYALPSYAGMRLDADGR